MHLFFKKKTLQNNYCAVNVTFELSFNIHNNKYICMCTDSHLLSHLRIMYPTAKYINTNTSISLIAMKTFTEFQNGSYEKNGRNSNFESELFAFSFDTVLRKTCSYVKRD